MADPLVDDLQNALGTAYTIERELTGGGMSRVFVAKEHALGREVVIKVLPPDLAAGVNRDRFRREVQLAARLSHPYIVPLLHAGEHGTLLWFTMPYIPGESLRARLQRDGALGVSDVLKLLRDVVEALAYAHSRGVIHRDIKPANILSDGHHALVTDFGVAKALNAALPMSAPGHTTSGMAIGTPAYMAPEQLAADPDADQRVDVYAVGLLAYELLSGVSPFAAASPTATMTAQLTRIPEPLHQLRSDIPPALSDLVQHCLAKSPEDRPADAQAILRELDQISGAMAADAHRSVSGESARQKPAAALPLILATAGVLALVAGGFWWTGRSSVVPAATDTSAVRATTDTGEQSVTLAARPMTRQDSLNIAEALRDQLKQIDPVYSKKAAPRPKVDTVSLGVDLATMDSLIKLRMGALYDQRAAGVASGGAPSVTTVTPAVPTAPVAPVMGRGTSTGHRLAILLPPDRGTDSSSRALARATAVELARRADRYGGWTGVVVDTVGPRRPGQSWLPSNADVLVFMSLQRDSTDSTRLHLTVRSADPMTHYASDLIQSRAVYQAIEPGQFDAALRETSRVLNRVKGLAPGAPWPQDVSGMSRMGNINMPGGPRPGPSDPGMTVRTYSAPRFDSLRRLSDSLRHNRPKRPDSY